MIALYECEDTYESNAGVSDTDWVTVLKFNAVYECNCVQGSWSALFHIHFKEIKQQNYLTSSVFP